MPTTIDLDYLSAPAQEGDSGATVHTYSVTRGGLVELPETVFWQVEPRSPTPADAEDFFGDELPSGAILFGPGETQQLIEVPVLGDVFPEASEGFRVVVSDGLVAGPRSQIDSTIVNDDLVTIRVEGVDVTQAEGDSGTTVFTYDVTRSGSIALAETVTLAVIGHGSNSATAEDFAGGALPSYTVEFAPGDGAAKRVEVEVQGDTLFEPDEQFRLVATDFNIASTPNEVDNVATILSDDTTQLTVSIDPAAQPEGNSDVTIYAVDFARSGELGEETVSWTVEGTGSSPATASDFLDGVLPSGVFTFAAGETAETILVSVAGDTLTEASETFRITATSDNAGTVIDNAAAEATIENDDSTVVVITALETNVPEGDAGANPVTFEITRTGSLEQAETVTFYTRPSGSNPIDGNDLVGGSLLNPTVDFEVDDGGPHYVTVEVQGDLRTEADEQFLLDAVGANPGTSQNNANAIVTIVNDDTSVTFDHVSPASFSEEDVEGGGTPEDPLTPVPVFDVIREGDLDAAESFTWQVVPVGDSPADPEDFAGGVYPSGTVDFAAGEGGARSFVVPVVNDTDYERDETFRVELSGGNPETRIETLAGDSLIRDSDPGVGFRFYSGALGEGNRDTTTYWTRLERRGDISAEAVVDWHIVPVSADADDFPGSVLPHGQVRFAAGQRDSSVSVDIAGDLLPEADEEFRLVLTPVTPGLSAVADPFVATILDDDGGSGAGVFDPYRDMQWHLDNTGQSGGTPGIDINLGSLWEEYTGRGVTVAVQEATLDPDHPDLALRYDAAKDLDDDDYLEIGSNTADVNHATAVAGLIAGAYNDIGVTGVAHGATLTGIDLFGSLPVDAGLTHSADAGIDVVNNSWGFIGSFNSQDPVVVEQAIYSVETGRDGLGVIHVYSAGNTRNDSTGARWPNGQIPHNLPETIVVAAVNDRGETSSYSSAGAPILISSPGADIPGNIVTTGYGDLEPGYTERFNGTSAAAPILSGVVALMLEANPGLGWRDVQDILAASANLSRLDQNFGPGLTNSAHDWNGGGATWTIDQGYGLVDATAAVRLAETWFLDGTEARTSDNLSRSGGEVTGLEVELADETGDASTIDIDADMFVEQVAVRIDAEHPNSGDLVMTLASPSGTVIPLAQNNADILLYQNTNYIFPYPGAGFPLGAAGFRGELAAGTWTLEVQDTRANGFEGTWDGWSLELQGRAAPDTGGRSSGDDRHVYTDEFAQYAGSGQEGRRTLDDSGGTDTLNAAAVTTGSTIDLNPGATGEIAGTPLTMGFAGSIEHAIAGDAADRLVGNAGANLLYGGRGDDILEGRAGADTLEGAAGVDVASYEGSRGWVNVSLETGFAGGGRGSHALGDVWQNIEDVTGSAFDDRLNGDDGDNLLRGGEGDDILRGRGGADVLEGGPGSDTVDYADADEAVAVDLSLGTTHGEDAAGDVFDSIENLAGSRFDDDLIGDAGDNVLEGMGGADDLNGNQGVDLAAYGRSGNWVNVSLETGFAGGGPGSHAMGDTWQQIQGFEGSAFADRLSGDDGDNLLRGGEGDDILRGRGGADVLEGGAGSDTADYADADEAVLVDLGTGATAGADALGDMFDSIENLAGSRFGDTLTGDAGSNRLEGMGGADTLEGGDGQDWAVYARSGGFVNVSLLTGYNGGGAGSHAIGDTWEGIENLQGSRFDDRLNGDNGDNVLEGGAGDDYLTGNLGADTFRFTDGFGQDTVADFADGVDLLDFSGHTGIADFAALTVSDLGADAQVADGFGNLVTLTDAAGLIDATDFLFAS